MIKTKEQIKKEISELEKKQKKYQEESSTYLSSINYMGRLIRNLRTCLNNYLNPAIDSLKSYFTIDNKTVDEGKLDKMNKEINDMITYLNKIVNSYNTTKNNLDKEISSIKTQIQKLRIEYNNAEN